MTRIAVLSDVHGNLQALEAVRAELRRESLTIHEEAAPVSLAPVAVPTPFGAAPFAGSISFARSMARGLLKSASTGLRENRGSPM